MPTLHELLSSPAAGDGRMQAVLKAAAGRAGPVRCIDLLASAVRTEPRLAELLAADLPGRVAVAALTVAAAVGEAVAAGPPAGSPPLSDGVRRAFDRFAGVTASGGAPAARWSLEVFAEFLLWPAALPPGRRGRPGTHPRPGLSTRRVRRAESTSEGPGR